MFLAKSQARRQHREQLYFHIYAAVHGVAQSRHDWATELTDVIKSLLLLLLFSCLVMPNSFSTQIVNCRL